MKDNVLPVRADTWQPGVNLRFKFRQNKIGNSISFETLRMLITLKIIVLTI